MAEEDKPKTAFSFGQGLWQFNVMPFGLCNAPGCFERLLLLESAVAIIQSYVFAVLRTLFAREIN